MKFIFILLAFTFFISGCLTSGGGGGSGGGSSGILSVTSISPSSNIKTDFTVTGQCNDSTTLISAMLDATTLASFSCMPPQFSATISVPGVDGAKNIRLVQGSLSVDIPIVKDTTSPQLSISLPTQDATPTATAVQFSGQCETGSTISILAGPNLVPSSSNVLCSGGAFQFTATASGAGGTRSLTINSTDLAGNKSSVSREFIYVVPPSVSITSPSSGTLASLGATISGVCEPSILTVVLAGSGAVNPVTVSCIAGVFSGSVDFTAAEGIKSITATQTDSIGRVSSKTITLYRDNTPPSLSVTSPVENEILTDNVISIGGSCETGLAVLISYGAGLTGVSTASCNSGSYSFSASSSASIGNTTFTVSQTDLAANKTEITRNIEMSVRGTWTSISMTNAPITGREHTAVWTGSRMIIWGGYVAASIDSALATDTGASFNPATNTWTPIASGSFQKYKARMPISVWTGSKMLVWGGFINNGLSAFDLTAHIGGYDPSANIWTGLMPSDAFVGFDGSLGASAVWTGAKMIVVRNGKLGAIYDPVGDSWGVFGRSTGSNRTTQHVVWTGTQVLIWNGSGSLYNPANNTWTDMVDAPDGYSLNQLDAMASSVWTGSEFIVWGGICPNGGGACGYGKRYNPSTNLWSQISTTNAPVGRYNHVSVWTGSKMIIFGGDQGGVYLKNGAMYDPSTNSWTHISSVGAPTLSSGTAVWTGTQLIVWGTNNSGIPVGGIYTP